ncbi:MAG TPA: PTS sugar transporter subunit IIA [Melioribacteraceae bacterium]|nr:PTS sugar transporter subunit IIA [Melioribacteraceae bacterium]
MLNKNFLVMNLEIHDITKLLLITEKEVKNLIKSKEIPFVKLNDKFLFNKQQIIEWALTKNRTLNIGGNEKLNEYNISTISNLLSIDSFFYECDFTETNYIDKMTEMLKIDADKEIIAALLHSREMLMCTSIGNGISLPHPRVPILLGQEKPLLNFFFTKNPLSINSIDGKPVHTFILLISQSIKQHLSLLAHLSYLLSKELFRFALEKRLDYYEIIDIIIKTEEEKLNNK